VQPTLTVSSSSEWHQRKVIAIRLDARRANKPKPDAATFGFRPKEMPRAFAAMSARRFDWNYVVVALAASSVWCCSVLDPTGQLRLPAASRAESR